MAECYHRAGSKARGTRAQFRLNTQGLLPFKCSYPLHLTDVMDIGQSSQSSLLRGAEPNKETRTLTVREYEQTINELKKENFDLKLRIYLLEDSIKKYGQKDGTIPDKSNSVEVIVELQVETEALRKDLSCKTKSLEDALDQIEKLQQDYSELQEQLATVAELPSKEQLIWLQDEKSLLQGEIENLHESLKAKNQELEEAACQIEELSSKNKYLEEKVKKSSIAIRGFISKHAKELELFPQAIRPTIQSAVESAKNNDYCNLDVAIKSLKSSLCEMMTVPMKAFISDSEDKENKDINSQTMCLNEETFKSGGTIKHIERHRSDPSVQLNNLQEFKDFTREMNLRAEKCSRSLELVHQEYAAREKMLSNNVTPCTGSISIELLESTSSLISPHLTTEGTVTTVNNFNSSHYSSSNLENAVQVQNISVTPPAFAVESCGTNDSCNISEHVRILKENECLKSEMKLRTEVIQELNNVCNETEMKQLRLQQEFKTALAKVKQLEITTFDGDKKQKLKAVLSKGKLLDITTDGGKKEFKDFTKDVDKRNEKCSQSLDLVHQDYSSRGIILSNDARLCTRSVSIELMESAPSLTSPHISTERTATTVNNFDSSHHSSSNSESALLIKDVSVSPHSFTFESPGTENQCSVSEHISILKENEYLKSEIKLKSEVIQELNNVCSETETKQLHLQQELKIALAKVMEITSSYGDRKVMSFVKPISTQTLNLEDQLMQFKESYKSVIDAAQSNNLAELKEEILMLLLTIEEKEKNISELKQTMENLEAELEGALNKKELESDDDMNEKNELRERLASSCSINNELIKHLLSLEAFMEDLLHQKNLDVSSLDNISGTSDFLSQLSKRLDESLRLSQVLSDHLSICEGSKVFGSEVSVCKDDDSMSDAQRYQHTDSSKLNLSKFDERDEGRRNFISSNQDSLNKFAGTGKRWSYSSQYKSSLLGNSDNVVVLGTSNNEDLILLLNENGDPADVLIRNSNAGVGNCNVESNFVLQNRDQHRRRCLVGESAANFDWNNTSNYMQNPNDMQIKALRPSHPWYGQYISSDSDIWSEPDRDISMQRIGIDVKSSPISSRSPRKLRFKDKRTTDDLGSDKNSSGVGAYKTQSWLRRRRSSGSASKRVFSKEASSYRKDYKLEKHFSLLSEKVSKFTMVSNQLEKIKNMQTEKSDVVNDIADELNGVVSSVNETLHKLTAIKENSKNCAPIICERCSIVELLLDLQRTRNRIHASDLLENINETKVEHLTQTLLSEVDDLKRQLEDPHAILSSGAENSESNFVISDQVTQINKLLSNEKLKNQKLQEHLSKLNDKCNSLDQELKEIQNKNVLNRDLENVNTNSYLEEQMFIDLKIAYEALSKELENIKKEKEILKKDLEIIQTERENLKLEFKKVESENNLLGKQLQMQEDHVKFLDDQLQSRKNEHVIILDEKEKIIKRKRNFENEMEELKGQNGLLSKQITALTEKYDNIFKQLKESKDENEFLKNKFSSEKDYNRTLKKQLEQLESKCETIETEKEEIDKNKYAEEEKLLADKNELLRRLKDIENEKILLENEAKNLVHQLNAVKKQLIESNDKCASVEKSKSHLEDQNKLVEENLMNFKNQKDFLKDELQKEKDQRIMLESELKKVEDIVLVIKKEKGELENEYGSVLKQLEDSKNINKSQEEDFFELKSKIKYFERELNDMQVKNTLIEKEKIQVSEKIHTLEKEKEHIEAKKKMVSQELKDVQCSKNSLERELEMYKDEKAELIRNLHETKEILSNEKSVINNLKMENDKLKNDVCNLKQEKSILNRERQALAVENNRNILQLKEVNTRNNDLQSFIHNLEQKNSETDKICTQLQSELCDTKEKLVKLDLKCSEYETQLAIESKNKNDHLLKLETLENDLSGKKKCITVITLEKDDLLKNLKNQKDKLIILEKEKDDLTVQLLDKEKEIDTLQKMHHELENEKFDILKEKKIVDEKLMTLTASYNELKKDHKAKGDHVKTLESKCISYENEIVSSSNTASNFIQKLETMKSELSTNIQVLNEIFGFNVTETISDMKKYSLDNLPVSQAEMIDKLCYNITMENCEFYKSLVTSVQHLKNNCLTLEKNKAKEEQLKLELCSLQSQIEFLQSELAFVNKQKDEMKNIIDEHIKSISDKEKMLNLKDSEKYSLQLQLLGIQDKVEKEQHQWKQLNIHEMEKDQFKKYSEHLQTIIDALQENLLKKEKFLTDCDNEIYSLKIKLVAFQNQIEKAESQLNVKDDEITRLQERIFNLQTQVNNLLAEKIDFDKQRAVKKVLIDAETSITDLSDFIRLNLNVLDKQTHVNFDKSCDIAMDSSKCDINSDEPLSPKSQVENMERLIKKINALQTKLSMAAKRIEILEEEKNYLRENLLTEVHARRKSSLSTQENINEKILELETKLEKKASFIKELKNELYKTCDFLVKKQEEVDDLRQKISVIDNLKSEIQFYRALSSNSISIETNISTLRKHKWELIQSIFDIQKQLYEKKGIHINHFQKFKNHIEHLHSLQVSPKLSKSESEPILGSQAVIPSKNLYLNSQKSLNCELVGLEIDIECLENLKIFLKRFLVPFILPNNETIDQNAEKIDHSISIIRSSSENGTNFDHVIKQRNFEVSESCPNCPALTSEESKKSENCDALPNLYYEWCKVAWTLSQKVDHVENIMKSLDSEFLHMKKLEYTVEGKSCVPVESLLQKMFHENKIILENTKIFHLNLSLKSSIFSGNLAKVSSKQDLSDHESLLSEETITLSRSGSVSPVSIEENLHVKVQSSDAATSKKHETCIKSNSKEVMDSYSLKLQTAGSSQDSVCQRSHYSSPDLGIESDPNHDSSAPEQMEKHESCKDTKASKAEIKIRPKLVGRQPQKTMYTNTDSRWKNSDSETFFAGGETLHAVGILQEYELLKREVQESLVGIKSVLSRTGDGLHHIAKYTSPRKNLEYSTFRAIKDTCANIEVCLKKAYKLVNNFWIAPCPTSDEWNSLIQENHEKGNKILMLKNSMQKQEEDFKIALNNLQEAQLVKEQMEKKIAKKLVKTKKILRRAEVKLLESECQNHLPLPNFPSESSHCQENH